MAEDCDVVVEDGRVVVEVGCLVVDVAGVVVEDGRVLVEVTAKVELNMPLSLTGESSSSRLKKIIKNRRFNQTTWNFQKPNVFYLVTMCASFSS